MSFDGKIGLNRQTQTQIHKNINVPRAAGSVKMDKSIFTMASQGTNTGATAGSTNTQQTSGGKKISTRGLGPQSGGVGANRSGKIPFLTRQVEAQRAGLNNRYYAPHEPVYHDSGSNNTMNALKGVTISQMAMQGLMQLTQRGLGIANMAKAGKSPSTPGVQGTIGGVNTPEISAMNNAGTPSELRDAIDGAQTKYAELNSSIEEKQESYDTAKSSLKDLQSTAKDAKSEFEDADKALKANTNTISKLESDIKVKDTALGQLDTAIGAVGGQISDIDTQLTTIGQQLNDPNITEEQRTALNAQKTKLESKKTALTTEKTKLEGQKTKIEGEKQALEAKLNTEKGKTKDLTDAKTNAENTLKDANKNLTEAVKTINEFEKQKKEFDNLKSEITKQQQRLTKLEQEESQRLSKTNEDIAETTSDMAGRKTSKYTAKDANKLKDLQKDQEKQETALKASQDKAIAAAQREGAQGVTYKGYPLEVKTENGTTTYKFNGVEYSSEDALKKAMTSA